MDHRLGDLKVLRKLDARVIPIPAGSKGPILRDWRNAVVPWMDLKRHSDDGGNLGIVLGQASRGLVDVDLDSVEARRVAKALLPRTELIHGREGSRSSHWWYRVAEELRTLKFEDPEAPEDDSPLVELRGDGGQTVVPPGRHQGTGEAIEWERSGKPAEVRTADLVHAVSMVAAASVLIRCWRAGIRQDLAMAVAGFLLRLGHSLDDVEGLLSSVASAAGDEEVAMRLQAARYTVEKLAREEPTTGWGKLAELIGEARAKKLREWVPDLRESAADSRKIPEPTGVKELLQAPELETLFLVLGLIEAAANVLIAGYPKSMKTHFVLELAIAMAAGGMFLGRFRVPKALRVGIVLMEDTSGRTRRRLKRIALSHGVDLGSLEGRLFFWFRPPLRLSDTKAMQDLRDDVERHDLDALFIDNWSRVSQGNSDSADEVMPQLAALEDLRRSNPNLTVGLVHHARKTASGQGKRVTDQIRNSSVFGAWFDSGFILKRDSNDPVIKVEIELRNLEPPEELQVLVEDEIPGNPEAGVLSSGYLRLRARDRIELKRELVDKEVLEVVGLNPGCTQSTIVDEVSVQKKRVLESLDRLIVAKRLRKEKRGRGFAYFVIDDPSDPDAPGF